VVSVRSPASGSGRSPRALALRVLRRVTEEGAYSNLALAAELGRSRLSARDRELAAELAYGTVRRRIPLDAALDWAATRPLDRIDPEALAILRLGTYQILYTRIPDHAAVSETVSLAGPRHRSFVNAILRRLAGEPPARPAGRTAGAISLRTGLATWAVEELGRLLPPDEVETAAAALASPAELCLRVNTCAVTPERLVARLRDSGLDPQPGRHHPHVVRVPSATPALLPGFDEGWFAIQDEASAVVVAAVDPKPGQRVLDACAGPGGKSTHLACLVRPDGSVVAADARAGRAGLVRGLAKRLAVPVPILVQDARAPALGVEFDAVLVDAPCSGLGAARRRPELLWRPGKQDLAHLARLQVAILVGASGLVKPGCRLVYSVCTFPRAETDAAVRAFLAKRPDFEPTDVPGPDGPSPTHRLWPHRHGTDAMFVAGFCRAKA
jgi:16S rRNA (cytosine967-C5)-methyltransferase